VSGAAKAARLATLRVLPQFDQGIQNGFETSSFIALRDIPMSRKVASSSEASSRREFNRLCHASTVSLKNVKHQMMRDQIVGRAVVEPIVIVLIALLRCPVREDSFMRADLM
jgi:hypothetical protein